MATLKGEDGSGFPRLNRIREMAGVPPVEEAIRARAVVRGLRDAAFWDVVAHEGD